MDIPFVFGKIADEEDFTDRVWDTKKLKDNFLGLVNTIIISPRRWRKTSWVIPDAITLQDPVLAYGLKEKY